MADLSSAAQAVLDAYHQEAIDYIEEWGSFRHKRGIAAALRAAADQVVPVPINAQTPDEHWALLGVKNRLLAIADELEAQYSDQLRVQPHGDQTARLFSYQPEETMKTLAPLRLTSFFFASLPLWIWNIPDR